MAFSLFAILTGAVASAVVSTVLFFVCAALADSRIDTGAMPQNLLAWIPVAFLINAIGAVAVGLPWRWLAEKNGWRDSWHYWLPAALCGFASALLLAHDATWIEGDRGWRWLGAMLPFYLYGAALGGFTAWFAWLIRRPDRLAANPGTGAP